MQAWTQRIVCIDELETVISLRYKPTLHPTSSAPIAFNFPVSGTIFLGTNCGQLQRSTSPMDTFFEEFPTLHGGRHYLAILFDTFGHPTETKDSISFTSTNCHWRVSIFFKYRFTETTLIAAGCRAHRIPITHDDDIHQLNTAQGHYQLPLVVLPYDHIFCQLTSESLNTDHKSI
jgi:hypothetical protein